MNYLFKVFLCFYLLGVSLLAQEIEKYSIETSDTSYRYKGIVPPVEYQYDLDEFFIEPLFNQIQDEILSEDNPSNIWLRTDLLISYNNLNTENGEVNTHFTSTLYQQYLRDSKFDMVSYVLGIAQTSAVAYMAYRHIKKYGFWK
ncbi:MAG: hypothetical protein WBQ32_04025 [Ignavibacteriaceae bacterium]